VRLLLPGQLKNDYVLCLLWNFRFSIGRCELPADALNLQALKGGYLPTNQRPCFSESNSCRKPESSC
jgi:hypothetical protein